MEAIQSSDALKVYVCNVMTQEGETEGYNVTDHIAALTDDCFLKDIREETALQKAAQ